MFGRLKTRLYSLFLMVLTAFALLPAHGYAAPFETKAAQAYVIETETGTVLLDKRGDDPVPPASLAKMMTVAVVFDAIKSGRISLQTEFPVSENAWRTGGAPSGTSTMFAALKSTIRVDDLLKGVMVQGANDGCLILAEGLSGSERDFVVAMNQKAASIGLTGSTFVNATGLPAAGQQVTMHDLVRLAAYLSTSYPDLFANYAVREFTWNKITQRNRNPLLAMDIAADGVLTGYTDQSGYAIVGSIAKSGRRVIAALGGFATEKERATEARSLFAWIDGAFYKRELFGADETVGEVPVYGGSSLHVTVRSKVPIAVLIPAGETRIEARIVYNGPLMAPVEQGDPVGTLQVNAGKEVRQKTPLFAAETVGDGPTYRRAVDAITELLTGWLAAP